jgi:FkbM family methyltransferase
MIRLQFDEKQESSVDLVWPKQDTQTLGIIAHDWVSTIKPFLQDMFPNKPKGSIIQAGGHCGLYPLLFLEVFEMVYTFEPDPLSFFCLVNNCQSANVVKFNAALADKVGLVNVVVTSAQNTGMNKVVSAASSSLRGTVPSVTIDSFGFEDVMMMELDLEGYEIPALAGATKTIEKYRPVIMLECGDLNNPADLSHHTAVREAMKQYGYKPYKQINRLDMVFLPE